MQHRDTKRLRAEMLRKVDSIIVVKNVRTYDLKEKITVIFSLVKF